MGAAVPLRTDFSAGELRHLAKRVEDADQARRLLSLAAVLDGMSRKDAAEIGAMDRQTLRDWSHGFNEKGPAGLINGKAPGPGPKLSAEQKQELERIVGGGADRCRAGRAAVAAERPAAARYRFAVAPMDGAVALPVGVVGIPTRPRQ